MTKPELKLVKKALQKKAGLIADLFSALVSFNLHTQKENESTQDFAMALEKLFTEAYPGQNTDSVVLLQRLSWDSAQPLVAKFYLGNDQQHLQKLLLVLGKFSRS